MPQRTPEYWWHAIGSSSFLEYAFLRWVLAPAVSNDINVCITAQREIEVGDRRYSIDYEIRGAEQVLAIELDGFEFHSSRKAFSYDRLRQNDLHATGCTVVRFSYDSIRSETERCVSQLQSLLALDPKLRLSTGSQNRKARYERKSADGA
jgi:very-short-patch-repair endonuclease